MRARNCFYNLILACGVAGLVAGCRDLAAPTSSMEQHHPTASLATAGVVGTVTFTYDPAAPGTFNLADQHRIEFPAGAVCDPSVSTYGVTEWDKPCTPLTSPVTITAVSSRDASGHPRVDFWPSLRFVSGAEVVLYLRDKAASEDPSAVIQWCGPDGQCVSEASFQASYQTRRDAGKGIVYRAIKHFSGYLISAG